MSEEEQAQRVNAKAQSSKDAKEGQRFNAEAQRDGDTEKKKDEANLARTFASIDATACLIYVIPVVGMLSVFIVTGIVEFCRRLISPSNARFQIDLPTGVVAILVLCVCQLAISRIVYKLLRKATAPAWHKFFLRRERRRIEKMKRGSTESQSD